MEFGVDPGLALFPWLRLAGLVGLLGFGIYRARRRWLDGAEDDQARRILYPWLGMVAGFSVYLGALTIFIAPFLIFWVAAIVALWVAVPALVSVLVVDLAAKLLGAERTVFWLGAGIVAFVGVTFIWLGLYGIGPLLFLPGLWLEVLLLCSVPAAGAISWWSFLPGGGGGGEVAKTFE